MKEKEFIEKKIEYLESKIKEIDERPKTNTITEIVLKMNEKDHYTDYMVKLQRRLIQLNNHKPVDKAQKKV